MPSHHILIIEDNDVLLGLLAEALTESGYQVSTAMTADEGRKTFDTGQFSAIISDVRLSGEQSGLDLLLYFKKTQNIPVVLMTGFSELLDVASAADIGADGFLPKPFTRADLERVLNSVLNPNMSNHSPSILEVANSSDCFDIISLEKITADQASPTDLYMRLSPTRYIKVLSLGDKMSVQQIDEYRNRGLRDLFTPRKK